MCRACCDNRRALFWANPPVLFLTQARAVARHRNTRRDAFRRTRRWRTSEPRSGAVGKCEWMEGVGRDSDRSRSLKSFTRWLAAKGLLRGWLSNLGVGLVQAWGRARDPLFPRAQRTFGENPFFLSFNHPSMDDVNHHFLSLYHDLPDRDRKALRVCN